MTEPVDTPPTPENDRAMADAGSEPGEWDECPAVLEWGRILAAHVRRLAASERELCGRLGRVAAERDEARAESLRVGNSVITLCTTGEGIAAERFCSVAEMIVALTVQGRDQDIRWLTAERDKLRAEVGRLKEMNSAAVFVVQHEKEITKEAMARLQAEQAKVAKLRALVADMVHELRLHDAEYHHVTAAGIYDRAAALEDTK